MSKPKPVLMPSVRIVRDPVSGKLESTYLDDVQKAFERLVAQIDGAMLPLSTADQHRLAARLIERVGQMVPHTDGGQ